MFMEFINLPQDSLRIKGKNASYIVDPQEKGPFNAALLLNKSFDEVDVPEDVVVVSGPGDYEVGGIKMAVTRSEAGLLYSMKIDGVDVVLGKINIFDKMQNKLKEHNVVVVLCNEVANAAFLTSLASNVVIFYGEKAKEVAQMFGRENMQHVTKYATTREKLPQELETIVLE